MTTFSAALSVLFATFGSTEGAAVSSTHAESMHANRDAAPNTGMFDAGVPRPAAVTLCADVFGYLPYWNDPSAVDFTRLSHVVCFGVAIDADGYATNTHGWPWTGVVADAHAAGAKVQLAVTNFDPASLLPLLQSGTARSRLCETIGDLLVAGNADGVNLDFEGSASNGWASLLPGFVAELRTSLEARIPGVEISLATPAVNWNNSWPIGALAAEADHLFVMGYDYKWSGSSVTGANAPLAGGSLNLTNTLTVEYADALADYPERVVLGLPLYGHGWTAASDAPHASVTGYTGSVTLPEGMLGAARYGRLWDEPAKTPWYAHYDGVTWRQVWYDDFESLGWKIDLAVSESIGGVGFWALGYQGEGPELWNLIDSKLVTPCACIADLTTTGAGIGEPGYGVPDGEVTGADIQYYVNFWVAGDIPIADVTTTGAGVGDPGYGVPDGQVTGADIQYYVNFWVAGCP